MYFIELVFMDVSIDVVMNVHWNLSIKDTLGPYRGFLISEVCNREVPLYYLLVVYHGKCSSVCCFI